ncbi:MAG: PilZ domain-containing protein [Nannocystaceae bacterium]|nr:PilZ domain-containing protein [Nannocystaceae bacterium]
MPVLDRRGPSRQRGWFAVRVANKGDDATTVAQNVSETGVLLVSRDAMSVGDTVMLSMHVDPANEPPWMLGGRVVRSLDNKADPGGLWPHKVAIVFDAPVPALVESVLAAS